MTQRGVCFLIIAAFLGGASPALALSPVSCLIEASETVKLATPVGGILAEIAVERGEIIQEGQMIARLDARVEALSRDLARARSEDASEIEAFEAKVEFLSAQAERRSKLAERNVLSSAEAREAVLEQDMAIKDLERARLSKMLAGLEADQAQAVLDQKTLLSPITGVVTERLATVGEYQSGETHVVTLSRINMLRVEAFVPIAYHPHLAVGQTVSVTPEAPFDRPREAKIRSMDRVFDAATATFGIRMELENPDLSLPAGLRCTVAFPSS